MNKGKKKIGLQFFGEDKGQPDPQPDPKQSEPQPKEPDTMSKIVEKYKAQIADLQAQIADRDKTIDLILDGKPLPVAGGQPNAPTKWSENFESLLRL